MPNGIVTAPEKLFEEIAKKLDIPAKLYEEAEQNYNDLAKYLESTLQLPIDVYVQGSFMLGTVIRPYRKQQDKDYDVDLVCEFHSLSKEECTPKQIKHLLGNALQKEPYNRILDEEGKRCWTLNYPAKQGELVGFHIDCLPCVPVLPNFSTKIALTNKDKETGNYNWAYSDPRAFKKWFDERQKVAFMQLRDVQKRYIFENSQSRVYNSIEEIPDRCVKTPLQKAIQILKRHRDVYFSNKHNEDCKPISMIITVLSAYLYKQELSTYEALKTIVKGMAGYARLFEKYNERQSDWITFDGETWEILSPVVDENYAETWHENNHGKARAFFEWVNQLEKDLLLPIETGELKNYKFLVENSLRSDISSSFFDSLKLNSNGNRVITAPTPTINATNPINKPWLE